jgi:hypothetical protein
LRVAIEDGLSQVRRAVEARGWQVVPLEEAWEAAVDAVVLTGQDDDLFGDETIELDVPVIQAQGLTAEEILRRLENEPRPERS